MTDTTTEPLSPIFLMDPFLFEEEDTITIFAPTMVAEETADDIFDQISQTITISDDGDGDSQEEFQINPTPIAPHGQIVIVPKLSVQNDSSLFDSGIASDILDLLRVLLLSNKKNNDDDAINSSPNKKRHCYYSDSSSSSPLHSSTTPSLTGFSTDEPAAKKLKTSSTAVAHQAAISSTTPTLKKGRRARTTHHRRKNKWDMRLQQLLDFKQTHGHCRVPNVYPENSSLAQWVKRHRHQYTLKTEGRHSTLSDERQKILDSVGFVWDAHECLWMERWNELQAFFVEHGHSNVPTKYPSNRHLSIWVKCQRRQYKLYQTGDPSNMTDERVRKLESLNFNWTPRGY